jgi:23S rRNA (guanosine2251-2'-O)-methyltransferase
MAIEVRNPHSVLAALETRPQDVIEVRLGAGPPNGAWKDVAALAQSRSVPTSSGPARDGGRRQRKSQPDDGGRLSAAAAVIKPREDVSLETLFESVPQSGDPAAAQGGLWLALDQIQDPHNVGAIFRTGAFFGVRGIVVTRDRSAPLNGAAYDVASGGLEYVPFSVQTNLSRTLDLAKHFGLWVLGTSEHAADDVTGVDRQRPWLLVLGNEEKGLRRLTQEKCDSVCRITPRGQVGSLNVSAAAAVLIAALTR